MLKPLTKSFNDTILEFVVSTRKSYNIIIEVILGAI